MLFCYKYTLQVASPSSVNTKVPVSKGHKKMGKYLDLSLCEHFG